MNETVLILIVGMAIVTYIPRGLPAVLSEKMKFSPKAGRSLQVLPYTAMVALIFLSAYRSLFNRYRRRSCCNCSGWKKCPVMVCVLGVIFAG